ncbi:MAG: hypothetical protein LBB13_02415 [Rickettsiales bacterium]|jgi:hypothetical protein|nr:hypothetical protein [Rickettsiales bacterium]
MSTQGAVVICVALVCVTAFIIAGMVSGISYFAIGREVVDNKSTDK